MRGRVCYSRLPRFDTTRRDFRILSACPFGLFPEISTPVEKTVEIRLFCSRTLDSGRNSMIFDGVLAEFRGNWCVRDEDVHTRRRVGGSPGGKVAQRASLLLK